MDAWDERQARATVVQAARSQTCRDAIENKWLDQ